MQVNNVEVLEDLSNYCREEFDIRTIENKDKLKRIMSALPAIWPILDDICTLERTKFLPRLVSRIVLKILKIRYDTFSKAVKRSNTQYYYWTNPYGEHSMLPYFTPVETP